MRNRKILMFASLSFFAIITSCREEKFSTNEAVIQDATVKNGRLYFPNKESLRFHYDKIKNESEEVIAEYIDSKDFISLRPILTEKNESIIASKLNKRLSKIREQAKNFTGSGSTGYSSKVISDDEILDDIDDLEEIIGDDAYGAFLNEQAEIQVGQEIYKYTDVGLFIVSEEKYATLKPYLVSKNISTDLLVPTEPSAKQLYIEGQPCSQLSAVIEDISYFNAMDCSSGGSSGGGSGYNPPPVTDPNQQMVNFINSLQNCSPHSGLFDGIFGDSDICIDKYESRYRVKTKAYNYNYLLVYNLGVKVKHQYKGWTGLWRKENCQELRLGVISGQFLYDYTSSFQYPPTQYNITTIYNSNNRLMFDATVNWSQNGLNITGYSTQGFPKILKDDIVIEQFANNQLLNQAIQSGNKNLTADKLNQMFWSNLIPALGNWWQNLGKPTPESNNITYLYKATPFGKVLIQKTMYRGASNDDKIEKSFDWGFQIGFNLDPSTGNISPTSGQGMHKPKEFRVLMYGIAKRNGQWHGSKINTINL